MNNQKNYIEFIIDSKIYLLEAIYGAAYIFVDKFYIFLDSESDNKIKVLLKGKKTLSLENLERAKGEFLNELLNYSLRLKISDSNKKIKELIVGQALVASVNCDTDEASEGDFYENDPLGIAVPWEDKYKKEK